MKKRNMTQEKNIDATDTKPNWTERNFEEEEKKNRNTHETNMELEIYESFKSYSLPNQTYQHKGNKTMMPLRLCDIDIFLCLFACICFDRYWFDGNLFRFCFFFFFFFFVRVMWNMQPSSWFCTQYCYPFHFCYFTLDFCLCVCVFIGDIFLFFSELITKN